ncbi:MAG: hypothetical protein GYB65_24055 [Chloroflexi bacterium]|nr:hypothetical protein [Chloroflexota bacterium]
MRKGFFGRLLAGVLVSSLLLPLWPSLALATPPHTQAQNVLVEGVVGDITKLNPLLATYNPVDRDITALIFEGLTTTNQYGEIVPCLAESWTVTDDGLQYFVMLRQDILWQDGIPFSSEDVVFTVQIMSSPSFPGADWLYQFWHTVEAEALGEHLVRFRLTQPLASFPDQLRIGMVPAHVLQGYPIDQLAQHPFNLSPIGTGPYQIEQLTATDGQIDGIQLRMAPVYRQRPEGADGFQLERIVFRTYPTVELALDAYLRGEVHSIASLPPDLLPVVQQFPNLSLYTAVAPHVGVLIYNWNRSSTQYVRNPRVRLALAHAINTPEIVARNLPGVALYADSPILPGSWAYQPDIDWPTYDPAQAAAMMATANISFEVAEEAPPPEPVEGEEPEATPAEGDAEETPVDAAPDAAPESAPEATSDHLAMSIMVIDNPQLVSLANDIAASWQPLGFVMSVDAVDAATFMARLDGGDFDAAIVEFSFEPGADPDPYVFWHQGQRESGQNYGAMNDRRISESLENARRDPVGINRVTHYRDFQELFAERAVALPLYYPLYLYAVDARVAGVQLGFLSTPSDRFRTIKDWRFVE